MTRVLVTGASGYVGSRLTAALAERDGVVVRALARKPAPFVVADEHVDADLLSEPAALAEAFAGVDAVVHLAGPNEVTASVEPDRALAETVVASRRVAEAAVKGGAARLVYVSTVHVYGARLVPGAVVTEEVAPEPRAPYAVARLASEHLLASAASSGLSTVVFRLTNSVGAPASPEVDRWSLVTNDLARQAATTGAMRLHSDGTQWRDFVALADVCRILADTVAPGSLAPGTYNLASGTSHTIRDLAGMVADAFVAEGHPRPTLEAPDPAPGAPAAYRVAPDRLAAAGWRADTPLPAAVAETVRFCLANRGRF